MSCGSTRLFSKSLNHILLVVIPPDEILRSQRNIPIFREFPNRRRIFFIARRLSRADIGLWFESLYSSVHADRRGALSAACSMAGGVMDDRSRTVFHTINNRYRRPVVNPELSSRGAGRRRLTVHALLSRNQEAIAGSPHASLYAFEYLRVLGERADSSIPIDQRFRTRKGFGQEIPRR